jgi:hypothetical protein
MPLHITRALGACIPRLIRVDITSILDLAHGGPTATDSTAEVCTAGTSTHDVHDEGGDEGSPAEPQEGSGGLRLAAVLLCVGGAVGDFVGDGVGLSLHR